MGNVSVNWGQWSYLALAIYYHKDAVQDYISFQLNVCIVIYIEKFAGGLRYAVARW